MANYTFGPSDISAIGQRLAQGGHTITLRAGTYTLNKPSTRNYVWRIGSNTTLIGQSGSLIEMGPTRAYPDKPGCGMILASGASYIRITGLSFTGNNTTGDYGKKTNILIVCDDCHHIEIDSCIFVHTDSDFIKFRNCHDSSVHNNRMWYSGHECLYLLNSRDDDVCYNIGFYNNDCRTRENGACRLGYDCHDIWIHHNTISGLSSGYSGNSFTGPAIEIDKGPTYNVDIYENTFTDIIGAGIWAFTNYGPTGSYNLLIHNNTFTRCAKASWLKKADGSSASWEYGEGDIVLFQIHNTKIYNNRFVSSGAHGALYIYNRNSTSHSDSTYNISYTNNRGAVSSDLKYTNEYSNHKITISGNIVGTGGGAGTGGTTPTPIDSTTPVVAIQSNPTSIATGGTTNLIWSATGCTSASLTRHASSTAAADWNYNIPLSGTGANSGYLPVSPSTTCIYRITGVYNRVSPIRTATNDCPITVMPIGTVTPTCTSFAFDSINVYSVQNVYLRVRGVQNAQTASIQYEGNSGVMSTLDITTPILTNGMADVVLSFNGVGTRSAILTLTNGGIVKTYSTTINVSAPPTPATPTLTFTASFTEIIYGDQINLNWVCSNATSLSINNIPQSSISTGSYSVAPGSDEVDKSVSHSYVYTAIATNSSYGLSTTTTKTVTITVSPYIPKIPLVRLQTDTQTIDIDQSARINWLAENTTALECNNGVGVIDPVSGYIDVSPTVTTTYTFTAVGDDGASNTTITINVLSSDIVSLFVATPSTVYPGDEVTLGWASRFGKYGTISNGVGSVIPARGSAHIHPMTSSSYDLTVSGSMGTETKTVSITVLEEPPSGSLRAYYTVDQPLIYVGEQATIAWTTENADVMACGQDIGFVNMPSGSIQVQPEWNSNYEFILAKDTSSESYNVPIYVMNNDYEFIEEIVPEYVQSYIDISGRRVYVSGGQSTSDTSYTWDIDTNASVRPNPSNEMITFAYDEDGYYMITLTSVNKDGEVLKQTVRASVINAE